MTSRTLFVQPNEKKRLRRILNRQTTENTLEASYYHESEDARLTDYDYMTVLNVKKKEGGEEGSVKYRGDRNNCSVE
jgi:hypothetical protein